VQYGPTHGPVHGAVLGTGCSSTRADRDLLDRGAERYRGAHHRDRGDMRASGSRRTRSQQIHRKPDPPAVLGASLNPADGVRPRQLTLADIGIAIAAPVKLRHGGRPGNIRQSTFQAWGISPEWSPSCAACCTTRSALGCRSHPGGHRRRCLPHHCGPDFRRRSRPCRIPLLRPG